MRSAPSVCPGRIVVVTIADCCLSNGCSKHSARKERDHTRPLSTSPRRALASQALRSHALPAVPSRALPDRATTRLTLPSLPRRALPRHAMRSRAAPCLALPAAPRLATTSPASPCQAGHATPCQALPPAPSLACRAMPELIEPLHGLPYLDEDDACTSERRSGSRNPATQVK
jgi:hypothetical protein